MAQLQDITLLITDGKHGDCQNQASSGYFFVSCKDVRDGWIEYSGARQITEDDYIDSHRRTQLAASDIVITNSGTIGRMALVRDLPETRRTTFQKSVAIVKPDQDKVIPQWLYYALLANRDALIAWAGGTAQKNLLLRDMRAFEIDVPPISEQRKIAAILSAYDDLIENNLRRIKILEEMAQNLYREWFVKFRFPGHQRAHFVDSAGGPIPEGWQIGKLGDACHLTMGQSPKSEFYNSTGAGLPFHQGVTEFGDRFPRERLYCTADGRIAEKGDILFSVRAPVGRINVALDRMVIGRGLSAIRHKTECQWFAFHLLKEQFQEEDTIGGGTIFKSVTKNDMATIPFLCPDLPVTQHFERVVEPSEAQIANLSRRNEILRHTRDLLLPKLISGELDVSELDIVVPESA